MSATSASDQPPSTAPFPFDGDALADIVIRTSDNVEFYLVKAILMIASPFFRDMFSLPQPPSQNSQSQDETMDGCPLISLQDSPDDLASLLIALYDGTTFGDNGREDFKVVSGILRLSTKYMVDSLRTKALAHLTEAWPPTLRGWDLREDKARTHEQDTGCGRGQLYPSPIVSNVFVHTRRG